MTHVTVEDAQSRLSELLAAAARGEDVVITRQNQPAVKLVPVGAAKPRPLFGSAKGSILYMADDFDAPLEDFKD